MINTAELASMQGDANTTLPDTASILRNTPTSTAGGWSQTFASIGTTKCRLSQMGPSAEAPAAGEIAAQTRWLLVTPAGTDIRPADRVQIGTRVFEVTGGGAHSWEVTRSFILVEIIH